MRAYIRTEALRSLYVERGRDKGAGFSTGNAGGLNAHALKLPFPDRILPG